MEKIYIFNVFIRGVGYCSDLPIEAFGDKSRNGVNEQNALFWSPDISRRMGTWRSVFTHTYSGNNYLSGLLIAE